jgi:hypothetical protein
MSVKGLSIVVNFTGRNFLLFPVYLNKRWVLRGFIISQVYAEFPPLSESSIKLWLAFKLEVENGIWISCWKFRVIPVLPEFFSFRQFLAVALRIFIKALPSDGAYGFYLDIKSEGSRVLSCLSFFSWQVYEEFLMIHNLAKYFLGVSYRPWASIWLRSYVK